MIDMSDEARQHVSGWVADCMEYWSQFDPTALITEDMVDAQPMPPDGFLMDASAVLLDALAGDAGVADLFCWREGGGRENGEREVA